jgi:tRNA(Arg) A34 adenosine deaminase TadA
MHGLTITVPSWVVDVVGSAGSRTDSDDARMQLAIELAAENVRRGGGPFGAAVFDGDRCVAAGVNRVLDTGYSIAHAEIVALMAMQDALRGTASAGRSLALFTSAEPCCQCYGAIVWSGVKRLVCAASTDDVQAIGFDEGPKPSDWQAQLRVRGFDVTEGLQREAAVGVLQEYRARGGVIYGLRHPTLP